MERWINYFGVRAPALILAVSLAITLLAGGYVHYSLHRENQLRFEARSQDLVELLHHRLERSRASLVQARSLFLAGPPVTREVFRDYMKGIGLSEILPGTQGVGFASSVPASGVRAHEARVAREGLAGYRVWPLEPARDPYYPILYIEPMDWRNQRALGFDMMSEGVRSAAMRRAVETGLPALSDPVKLVQETAEDTLPGFLLYLPLFAPDRPQSTPAERWAALRGFVYSPFRAQVFFETVYGKAGPGVSDVEIEIRAGEGEDPSRVLYLRDLDGKPASQPKSTSVLRSGFERSVPFEFGGARWRIEFRSLPSFVSPNLRYAPLAVLGVGWLVSLGFFAIARAVYAQSDERRLLAGELLLKSDALENSLNGFDIVDETGKLIYVNRAYLRMWGFERAEEVLGTSPASHCADPEVPLRIISELKRKGECDTEFLAKRKDGSTFMVRMWARLARDSRGREIYPTTSIDITEQRRVEEERLRSLEVLTAINDVGQKLMAELDQGKLVQLVTDAATKLTGAQFGAFFYTVTDPSGEKLTLYTVSGVPRSEFEKFPMPRNTAVFQSTFMGKGTVRSDDIRRDPRYGRNAPYRGMPEGHLPVASYLAVSVFGRGGEVMGGLFFGHEKPGVFTEQSEKIVEGLAAQTSIAMDNAKLYGRVQESVRARDEFLSIASHELKTPVTSLKLQFQTTARRISKGDAGVYSEDQVRKRNAAANRQIDRLAKLIEDMLDVSRISTGRLPLSFEQVDLRELVSHVLDRFAEQLRASGIDVEVDLPPEPLVVEADPYRMEQVLDNLLTNALKYGENKPIRVSLARAQPGAVLQVRDQGMGIAQENLERVFQRFERAVSHINISGLGIGLYICRQIVEAQSGRIRVESSPGQGSTFIVELPERQPAAEQASKGA